MSDKRKPPRPGFPSLPCKHSWSDWSGAFWVELRSFRDGHFIRNERRQRRTCKWCGHAEERVTNA